MNLRVLAKKGHSTFHRNTNTFSHHIKFLYHQIQVLWNSLNSYPRHLTIADVIDWERSKVQSPLRQAWAREISGSLVGFSSIQKVRVEHLDTKEKSGMICGLRKTVSYLKVGATS